MKRKTALAPGTVGKCGNNRARLNFRNISRNILNLDFKVNVVGDEKRTVAVLCRGTLRIIKDRHFWGFQVLLKRRLPQVVSFVRRPANSASPKKVLSYSVNVNRLFIYFAWARKRRKKQTNKEDQSRNSKNYSIRTVGTCLVGCCAVVGRRRCSLKSCQRTKYHGCLCLPQEQRAFQTASRGDTTAHCLTSRLGYTAVKTETQGLHTFGAIPLFVSVSGTSQPIQPWPFLLLPQPYFPPCWAVLSKMSSCCDCVMLSQRFGPLSMETE